MSKSVFITTGRWLLVPVSMALMVVAAYFAGRGAVHMADAQCIAEHMIGGACVEPWHTTAVEVSIYGSVILAALGLTLLPALIAPRFKTTVAAIGLVLLLAAFGYVYYLTRWPEFLAPMLVAAVVGVLALTWNHRRKQRHGAA